ncbi:hypothetical protein Tco_0384972 [Tanacetum coccineum]
MKKDKENVDNSNAKRRKRWSFGKSMKDPSQRATMENDSTRMRSCMSASEKEQNKHVVAIAATATTTAHALWPAHKLSWLLSDFLAMTGARRALRALRGLVKFQALVKGFLVKKQVAATLYSMQALLIA